MNRWKLLVTSLSVLVAIATFSTSARACSLFEEPLSLNTQVFRLENTDTPETAASDRALNRSSEAPTSDPYDAPPLSSKPRQIIFIGNQPNRNFQVVVTDSRRETLAAIRICILDAFATQTKLGKYIQVGSFAQRAEAEEISRKLTQAGYPAQVIRAF